MNNQANTFQVAVLAVLGVVAFVAVLVFAGVLPGFRAPSGGSGGIVTLWSPLPEGRVSAWLTNFQNAHRSEFTLQYVYHDPATLDADLVEALAAGRGPDLIIWPTEAMAKRLENIYPIPYSAYTQLDFNNNFLRAARLYLTGQGLLALPLYVDPLVLYYNADLFSAAHLVTAPKTWKDLQALTKTLNHFDAQGNLLSSTVALGKANNIRNAKDILALLAMQAGSSLTQLNNGHLQITVAQSNGSTRNALGDALDFFNRFANSADELYSWNSAQPEARDAFLRGRLAMYLGYGSEFDLMARENPQLSVEVAAVPQVSATASLTLGRLYGLSLLRGSKNLATAAQVAALLSAPEADQALAQGAQLPPANKSLLANFPTDPVATTLYQAAISSQAWLDPDPEKSRAIFERLVENSQAGAVSTSEAVSQAVTELQALVK